jgi:hypothetical protein
MQVPFFLVFFFCHSMITFTYSANLYIVFRYLGNLNLVGEECKVVFARELRRACPRVKTPVLLYRDL